MNVYVFGGSKNDPNWHYTECALDCKPIFGWDKKAKRFYCKFILQHRLHLGAFYILSLKQMIVLPFKHRLYFSERRAKRRQEKNHRNRSIIPQDV